MGCLQMESYGGHMINQKYFMAKKDILNLIFIKLKKEKNTRSKDGLFYLTIL